MFANRVQVCIIFSEQSWVTENRFPAVIEWTACLCAISMMARINKNYIFQCEASMSTSICIFLCQLDHKVGRLNRRSVPHVEKFTSLHTSLSVEGYSQGGSIADHDNWMGNQPCPPPSRGLLPQLTSQTPYTYLEGYMHSTLREKCS